MFTWDLCESIFLPGETENLDGLQPLKDWFWTPLADLQHDWPEKWLLYNYSLSSSYDLNVNITYKL